MLLTKACLKCGGDCTWDEDDKEWQCIQGGHHFTWKDGAIFLPPIPARPELKGKLLTRKGRLSFKGREVMRSLYDDNREQITFEIGEFGQADTRERWGIAPSTWVKIRQRWGLPILPRGGQPGNRNWKGNPPSEGVLPPFPAFNEGWNDSVKVAWLEAYSKLPEKPKVKEYKLQ